MNKITIIKLEYPISKTENGKTSEITSVTIGRIKGKHLSLLPEGDMSNIKPKDMIPLIAGLADITVEEAGEIDMKDLLKISEVVTKSLKK